MAHLFRQYKSIKREHPFGCPLLIGAPSICFANRPPAAGVIEKQGKPGQGFPCKHPFPCGQQEMLHLFCQRKAKRNTTHSGGVSFWSTFDLRCKSPACGDFYRKAEGNPQRFPPQTPPSSRRTKDSAFVRRKELAADTHARSAFQSEVRQGFCVERISSIPRAWI